VKLALVVHHARPTGGQDRYVLELARGLAPRHEVHLVVVRAEGLDGAAVRVHELPIPDRPVLFLQPRFARAAAAIVARERFDLVHAVGGCLPGASVVTAQYVHAAWRAARRRYHVRESPTLVHALYHRLVGRQAEAFDRRTYGHPALRAVIAVSRRTRDELARHHGVGTERIRVVPNGVDPATFDRARWPGARAELRAALGGGLAGDAPVALLIGTFARKGLDTAIAALARASGTAHLVVAGTGDTDWANRVAGASGLAGRLHLLGPRRDIAALCAAADVFLLPTRYEPFGMVIAEAMAASLPVVVAGCAGAAEYVRNGENGFVVEDADDVEGFAAALRAILADRSRAEAVGRAARETAGALAWPLVVAQTEAVYRLAAGAGGGGGGRGGAGGGGGGGGGGGAT